MYISSRIATTVKLYDGILHNNYGEQCTAATQAKNKN